MKRNFKSIKSRIMFFFIGVAVFQILAVGFFAAFHLRPSITNMYTEHLNKFTQSAFWEVSTTRLKIETYMVNMIGDASIQSFLESVGQQSATESSPVLDTELRNRLLAYTDYDSAIRSIYLIDGRGMVYGNLPGNRLNEYLANKKELADRRDASAVWYADYDENNLLVYRIVNNNRTDLTKRIGAICMIIDKNLFADRMDALLLEDDQNYILASLDEKMKIASAMDANSENNDQYISCREENDTWYLLTWIDKQTAYEPVNVIFRILAGELILLLIVSTMLVIYLSGRVIRPIMDIRNAMKQMGQGNIGIKVPVSMEDEIGQLAGTMNRMSERIEELVAEIKEEETRQRLLQLKAMQYQINPHFLYNALDSISMYAHKNNDEQCEQLVIALSNFFRISLSHGREYVTLEEEIRYVECYLDIQNIRFPGQISWTIDVEPDLLPMKIIKFILQPLVENSIYHGIRDTGGRGHILVSAKRGEKHLVLRVQDDGMGMLPEDVWRLEKEISSKGETEKEIHEGGFGMRNVNQRLKLIYGEESGIEIHSEWEEGTEIVIRLPLHAVEVAEMTQDELIMQPPNTVSRITEDKS